MNSLLKSQLKDSGEWLLYHFNGFKLLVGISASIHLAYDFHALVPNLNHLSH